MAHGLRRLRSLWRALLRLERPRQAIVIWRSGGMAAVLLGCVLVALLSSWPWLVQPSLSPGQASPLTLQAPASATVVDSTALEQRRSQLVPRTSVQVIDPRASAQLQAGLDQSLEQVRAQRDNGLRRVDQLSLTREERQWLARLDPIALASWEQAVRNAQLRMLRQGIVGNLSDAALLDAASLQLQDQAAAGRHLGSRLISRSLQGRTNLRTDPVLSQQRIEELVSLHGLPTLSVQRGD